MVNFEENIILNFWLKKYTGLTKIKKQIGVEKVLNGPTPASFTLFFGKLSQQINVK